MLIRPGKIVHGANSDTPIAIVVCWHEQTYMVFTHQDTGLVWQ